MGIARKEVDGDNVVLHNISNMDTDKKIYTASMELGELVEHDEQTRLEEFGEAEVDEKVIDTVEMKTSSVRGNGMIDEEMRNTGESCDCEEQYEW